jgi:hypothetical protein
MQDLDQRRTKIEGTLQLIEDKFSRHYIAERFQSYIKEGVMADYARNLGTTVTANPIPVTLLGVSLAWMMFTGNGKAHDGQGLRSAAKDAAEPASALREQAGALAHSATRKAGAITQSAAARINESASASASNVSGLQTPPLI